ncbi:nucleotide exchange factor GrpE [Cumulibacter manganitolerans]|uniref:nucleotide exchange factor GrpE n=1 Tax=Cumulibacter manganitolerans TaxID=1884992 RepID=UPI0012959DE7|nr:nucleotide exchange factor GrpE [Cumulibacter manganitolerans]
MSEQNRDEQEPIVIRDNRRVNDESGAPRTPSQQGGGAREGTDAPSADAAADASPEKGRDSGPADVPTEQQLTEIDRLTKELAERTSDLQRVSAEYANYRRRADRERETMVPVAQAALISKLVPVLDDIDRADQHGDLTGGFKTVADALRKVLGEAGLEAFGAEGEPFDPQIHQAVAQHSSAEVDAEQIGAVMRKGYRQGDRVLREAMVAVVVPE